FDEMSEPPSDPERNGIAQDRAGNRPYEKGPHVQDAIRIKRPARKGSRDDHDGRSRKQKAQTDEGLAERHQKQNREAPARMLFDEFDALLDDAVHEIRSSEGGPDRAFACYAAF